MNARLLPIYTIVAALVVVGIILPVVSQPTVVNAHPNRQLYREWLSHVDESVENISVDHSVVTVGEGDTANNTGTVSSEYAYRTFIPLVLKNSAVSTTVIEGNLDIRSDVPREDLVLQWGYLQDTSSVTLVASVGSVVNNGDGTWSWAYVTSDGPSQNITVTINAVYINGATDQVEFELVVNNVAPRVSLPTAEPEPSNEGSAVTTSAAFSDPGVYDGPFTCTVNYGDGSGDLSGTVDGYTCTGPEYTYADNGSYPVTISVTDKDGDPGTSLSITHLVDNLPPAVDTPIIDPEPSNEGGAVMASAPFSDAGEDDAPFTCTVNYGDGSGALTGTFDGYTCTGPEYAYADNDSYPVTISVTDKDGGTGTSKATHKVNNLPPVVSVPTVLPEPSDEGSAVTTTATFSDPGVNDAPFSCTVNYGDGSEDLWGTVDGNTCTGAHTYADNGSYPVTISVTDKDNETGISPNMSHWVKNVAPTVGEITAPVGPTRVNTEVYASVDFTDPGVLDTHTATWDWGDDGTSEGAVNEVDGSGSVTGSHTYTGAGVYTVMLTVTDKDGDSGKSIFQYVVVYDPDGGFVTGGGWIDSPEGAYTPDPTLTGKATFGFVSKYKKGADVPTGQKEFQFHVADLNFHSDIYQWLVVSDPKVQFMGTGTINGAGSFGFMVTATDEELTPSTDVDLLRIKIWDIDNGDAIVYDNQLGAADDADPTTEIGGGNIKIHEPR